MNLLVKGLTFLFQMSEEQPIDAIEEVQDEEEEEQVEAVKSEASASSSPAAEAADEEELEIEEEKEPLPKPKPKKKAVPKKRAKKEEASSSADDENQLDPYDLSDNKAAKRIALSGKATFQVIKVDSRTRRLAVTLPKSKKAKEYPFVDFPEELIPGMQKLVEERPKLLKDQMSLLDCANHTPRLFWNAIYHWKTTDALEQKLQEAGLTTSGRRTRRRVAN